MSLDPPPPKSSPGRIPTWEGSSSPKGKPSSEVARAKVAEQSARRRLARLQRAVGRASLQLALETHQQRNREMVSGVKEDMDRRVGRDLTQRLARVTPLKDEALLDMSRMFNEAMTIFPDPNTRDWFKLFNHIGARRPRHPGRLARTAPAAALTPPPCAQMTTGPAASRTSSSREWCARRCA